MLKRGQAQVITYIIVAFIIVAISFFGYKSFAVVKDRTCKAEMAKFQTNIRNLEKEVKFGNVKEFTKQVPCGVDEIYFFDLEKNIDLEFLDEMPFIKDSLENGAKENVFLMENSEIKDSFYAGNLNIEHPDYICFLPKFGNIDFFLEGKGDSVLVIPGCLQPECTYFTAESEDDESVVIFNEAVEYSQTGDCDNCPNDVEKEWADFVRTRENVDIYRKYKLCREEGKTNVEIIIKPKGDAKLKEFRFYESFPKECIEELSEELIAYLSENYVGKISIKADPLIVWSFDEIKEEQKISYVLDTVLSEKCRKIIEARGVAKIIGGGIEVSEIPELPEISSTELPVNEPETTTTEPDETPPEPDKPVPILDIPDLRLGGDILFNTINLLDFTEYPDDKKYQLAYSMRQEDKNAVECRLSGRQITCDVKEAGKDSSSEITIEARADGLMSHDTFIVSIEFDDDSEETTDTEIKTLALKLPDDTDSREVFEEGEHVIYDDLWEHTDYPYGEKASLTYEIIDQTNTDLFECNTDVRQVKCKAKKSEEGISEVTVQVSDGHLASEDTFTISLGCTDECSKETMQECISDNFYQKCGNFDEDDCLELVKRKCEEGFKCNSNTGQCEEVAEPETNELVFELDDDLPYEKAIGDGSYLLYSDLREFTSYTGNPENLTYEVTKVKSTKHRSIIDCWTEGAQGVQLICRPVGWAGLSYVTVRVSDGHLTDEDIIEVTVRFG